MLLSTQIIYDPSLQQHSHSLLFKVSYDVSPLETFFPHDQHFPIYGHPVEIILSVVIQISQPSYDPLPLRSISYASSSSLS